jgi:MFS family permease
MRSAAQGLIASLCGRSGGAAAFLLFGVLLGTLGLPWRTAVLLLAALGMACGALFLLLFRNTPREHPWANQAEADLITAHDPEAAVAARSRLNWFALLRSRSILFLFLRAVASNMADVLYIYWLPLYLRTLMKVEPKEAGWMAALPLVGGALGGAVSGFLQSWLLLRGGNRRWVRSGVALVGKLLAAGLMLSALGIERPEAIALVFLAVKFFSDWEQPAEWGAATDIGGRNSATVFACINTAGSLGGFIAGPLIGFVLQSNLENNVPTAAGWNAVFVLIALEYFVAAACWLAIDCRRSLVPAEITP